MLKQDILKMILSYNCVSASNITLAGFTIYDSFKLVSRL